MSPLESAFGGSAGVAAQVGLQPGVAPPKGPETIPREWNPLTLSVKVKAEAGASPAARLEGSNVRLRGALQIETGQEVANTEAVATLPEALRPAEDASFLVVMTTVAAVPKLARLVVKTNLNISLRELAAALKVGNVIALDGITFPIV